MLRGAQQAPRAVEAWLAAAQALRGTPVVAASRAETVNPTAAQPAAGVAAQQGCPAASDPQWAALAVAASRVVAQRRAWADQAQRRAVGR
jgi:hypothetical protein